MLIPDPVEMGIETTWEEKLMINLSNFEALHTLLVP